MKILVINGPNINMLGTREPEIYGTVTMDDINKELIEYSKSFGEIEFEFFQSNHEGEIIDKIQNASDFDGLLINPAAYTHTSIAIADAIKATQIKAIEIHLSNPHTREDYRKISYTASACVGVVAGFGKESYKLALTGLINKINE